MSFLEMAKRSMANAARKPDPRVLGGRLVNQVLWETEAAVIFRDPKGHFWRYLIASGRIGPAVTRAPQ